MEFEWDDEKAKQNLRTHGVDFADACHVFFDPSRLEDVDDLYDEEERFITIGDVNGRILFVVFTLRDGRIRLISARKATRSERKRYGAIQN